MKNFALKFIGWFLIILVIADLPALAVGTLCAWIADAWFTLKFCAIICLFFTVWLSFLIALFTYK